MLPNLICKLPVVLLATSIDNLYFLPLVKILTCWIAASAPPSNSATWFPLISAIPQPVPNVQFCPTSFTETFVTEPTKSCEYNLNSVWFKDVNIANEVFEKNKKMFNNNGYEAWVCKLINSGITFL